jgi:pantoate--beta-alanine ligase
MYIAHDVTSLRTQLAQLGGPIAFVPTMGNLHEGHLSLLAQARRLAPITVVSIFVNPLQFLPHEDFDRYPRTPEQDQAQLQAAGCDVLLMPDTSSLLAHAQSYRVTPPAALAEEIEGAFRPGFFTGVCTIVMKLLHAVSPQIMLLGKKDYQQWRILQQMARDFLLPVEVVGVDTVREADGLALSSRNQYLNPVQRAQAAVLPQTLRDLTEQARLLRQTTHPVLSSACQALEQQAQSILEKKGFIVDYVCLRQATDLQTPTNHDTPWVALAAARLGSTRLIDAWEV